MYGKLSEKMRFYLEFSGTERGDEKEKVL